METIYQEEERYFKAKKKVEIIKGFYGHLTSFIVVNIGFFAFNRVASPNYLWFDHWFYWNLLIWGIGLFLHGWIVFNGMPFFGKNWEKQKIKQFMDKEINRSSSET
jgi:hypothetical protein